MLCFLQIINTLELHHSSGLLYEYCWKLAVYANKTKEMNFRKRRSYITKQDLYMTTLVLNVFRSIFNSERSFLEAQRTLSDQVFNDFSNLLNVCIISLRYLCKTSCFFIREFTFFLKLQLSLFWNLYLEKQLKKTLYYL